MGAVFKGVIAAAGLAAAFAAQRASAQSDIEAFYKSQPLRILVGYGPGTGYDVYARALGRHIARFIPGEPTVVIQNMPGAASLTMTNALYNVAPRDGSNIGLPARNLLVEPLYGNENARFDARRFTWLGSMNSEVGTCFTWYLSGITRLEDAQTREVLLGAPGTISPSYIYPTVMNALIGTHFKIVTGYPDSNATGLAMERGEVAGHCGFTWGSIKAAHRDWVDNKRINVIAQLGLTPTPELPDVPSVMTYAKDETTRQAFTLVFADQEMARPVGGPPDVPAARAEALRAAFAATMKDPAFLDDAKKTGVDVDPLDAPAVEAILGKLYATPPAIVARVKRIRGG
jgi:tripartite-type tricarboxylate transporter receptor subunit TctC